MEGIIIKNESNNYVVRTNKGINICKPRGKFRIEKITPLVGDNVVIDVNNNYILNIKERKNYLIRPQIANVDIALIVTSVKEPNFDSNLLDKLLTVISYNNIEPVICLTKLDLLNNNERKEINLIVDYYKSIGYKVINNNNIKEIKKIIANKTIVFAGQSGAGKSSLLNKLDKTLSLETNEISKAIQSTGAILQNGIGKHTKEKELTKLHKIYIGGDLLQRGLTFSNLVVSYFTRFAKSGGNMDTTLQRARWFGYRSKYLDLCKIFTTNDIAKEFTVLAEVEDDLWEQFDDLENGNLEIKDIIIKKVSMLRLILPAASFMLRPCADLVNTKLPAQSIKNFQDNQLHLIMLWHFSAAAVTMKL